MKNMLLGLVFLVTTVGLAAKPLTITIEEYQFDPAAIEEGKAFTLEGLEGLKPTLSQAVELSPEGNGKAVTTIGDSTLTTDVRAEPSKDSYYQIEVRHDFVAAMAGDVPLITSRVHGPLGVYLNVGDRKIIGSMSMGSGSGEDHHSQGYVWVVKLTD